MVFASNEEWKDHLTPEERADLAAYEEAIKKAKAKRLQLRKRCNKRRSLALHALGV